MTVRLGLGRLRSRGTRCRGGTASLSVSSGPVAKTSAASVGAARDRRVPRRAASKPGHVDPQVLVGRQALGDLDGDAVGRVQVERVASPAIVSEPAALVFLKVSFEQPQAVLEVAEELLLLLADDVSGSAGRCRAARGRAALIDLGDDRDELVQERLALAHLVGVEHGPAEQAADDVALLLGRRAGRSRGCRRSGPGRGRPSGGCGRRRAASRLVVDARAARRRRRRSAGRCRSRSSIGTPCRQAAARSRPMPVSMFFLGSGSSWPGPTRLNWVKTRFQISTSSSPSPW